MEKTYERLYDYYAEPLLSKLPSFDDGEIDRLAAAVPEGDRLEWTDALAFLQLRWCTDAFSLGVRLGLDLARRPYRSK